jgi:hypothetical protein
LTTSIPTGKESGQSFKKKKDAEAELGKRVSLIAEGRYLDKKKEYTTILGEVVDKYVENFGQQSSYQTSKRFYVTNIEEYFGRDTLEDVPEILGHKDYEHDIEVRSSFTRA